MNGAESLVKTLASLGVNTWLCNPGTSEITIVQAIDHSGEVDAILCLFEGVCTGAADGYARMTRKPAATLLHMGPGLAYGLANLHNAKRADSPIFNIVGDHTRSHVPYDTPLTTDVEAIARPVSNWVRTTRTSRGLSQDTREGCIAALTPNPFPCGAISTLVVPMDCSREEGTELPEQTFNPSRTVISDQWVAEVTSLIDQDTAILLDGDGLSVGGVEAAGRIASKTGCELFAPVFFSRIENGPNLPQIRRLPYFPEAILRIFESKRRLILAGSEAPGSFFHYEGVPSRLVPSSCEIVRLAHRHEDVEQALNHVADLLQSRSESFDLPPLPDELPMPTGELIGRKAIPILGRRIPDHAIISVDSGGGNWAFEAVQRSVRHSWLTCTGGAIGQGGPVAMGAAIACRDRPVFALLGDGGAMYTIQYLWTTVRENLNLVTIVYANRQYNILEAEYLRLGESSVGPSAHSLFSLEDPSMGFVGLANSMGMPAERATTCEEFDRLLAHAAESGGPFLIEAVLSERHLSAWG